MAPGVTTWMVLATPMLVKRVNACYMVLQRGVMRSCSGMWTRCGKTVCVLCEFFSDKTARDVVQLDVDCSQVILDWC